MTRVSPSSLFLLSSALFSILMTTASVSPLNTPHFFFTYFTLSPSPSLIVAHKL